MPTHKKTVAEQVQEHPDLIPSLPDVVAKAIKLLDDPNSGPAEFDALLSRDPPLVATILRLANSPVYGFAHKKETVREAIVGMGLKGLRGVLMGSTLKKFLGRQYSCYGDDPMTLWHHALAVATGSRALTKSLPGANEDPDEMFVAGLLHDLGKLLLAQFLTRSGESLANTAEPAHLLEKRSLGMNHQEAGGVMAERWNLTPLVRAVIAYHHHKSCPDDFRRAVAIVRLVDRCATDYGYAAGSLPLDPDAHAEDLAAIGQQPEEWAETRMTLGEAMQQAVAAS